MNECVFCKIAGRLISAYIIYEDEYFLAFLDINPIVEGHTVLISKTHFETIYDLGDPETRQIGSVLKLISNRLKLKFGANVDVVNTSGKYASQSIPHFHFHLIPRKKDDRLWDGERSRIVLDRSSGFRRLHPEKEQFEKLQKELTYLTGS